MVVSISVLPTLVAKGKMRNRTKELKIMTGVKVMLMVKSVGMLSVGYQNTQLTPRLSVGPTKHHELCQEFVSRNSGTSESCHRLWEVDRSFVKKNKITKADGGWKINLTLYLYYHGVGLWLIAADKLLGSKGKLTLCG